MTADDDSVDVVLDHILLALLMLADMALDPAQSQEVAASHVKLKMVASRAQFVARMVETRLVRPQCN